MFDGASWLDTSNNEPSAVALSPQGEWTLMTTCVPALRWAGEARFELQLLPVPRGARGEPEVAMAVAKLGKVVIAAVGMPWSA